MMEWIAEAILLIFTGVLVALMTARYGADDPASQTVFVAAVAMLLALAAVSPVTGGRVSFIMYRLCVPVFTLSAALILLGTLT